MSFMRKGPTSTFVALTLACVREGVTADSLVISPTNTSSSTMNGSMTTSVINLVQETEAAPKYYMTETQYYIVRVCLLYPFLLVNAAGIAGNCLNIIVFTKLGFAEASNVSLLALAIVDMLTLITAMWFNVCFIPEVKTAPGIPFNSEDIQVLTGEGPRVYFSKASGFITAYISVERCLCVVMPLRFKRLSTPGRTLISMIIIYMVTLCPMAEMYWRYRFDMKFFPDLNRTLLGLSHITSEKTYWLSTLKFIFYGFVFPFTFFFVVSCATVLLIVTLRRSAKWRAQKGTRGTGAEGKSGDASDAKKAEMTKEDRLTKTVLVIAVVFIVFSIPNTLYFLCIMVVPGFETYTDYRRTVYTMIIVALGSDSINSSVNILIYYRLSSKFREKFNSMLCCCSNKMAA